MNAIPGINFLLIGFGDLSRKRLYPELLKFQDEGRRIHVYPCDIKREIAQIAMDGEGGLLENYVSNNQARREDKYKQFQNNFYCATDDPNQLWTKLIRTNRTLAYIAIDDPEKYQSIIMRYVDRCDLLAIEKPFALTSDEARRLASSFEQHQGKLFIPIDHYRHKWVIKNLKHLLGNSTIRRFIDLSDAIQFSVLEKEPIEAERKNLLTRIGVIFDIAPHIFAALREITYSYDEIDVEEVYLASYTELGEDERETLPLVPKSTNKPLETYAEIVLTLFKNTAREKRAYVRFGKGTGLNEGEMIFHAGKDMLKLDLRKEEGISLNLHPIDEFTLPALAAGERKDRSYVDVLSSLINFELDEFMSVEDAVRVTEKIEEVKRKAGSAMELYKQGNVPALIEAHQGIKWHSLNDYIYSTVHVPHKVIIFDLFGVVINYAAAHSFVFGQIFSELGVNEPKYLEPDFLRQNPQTIVEAVFSAQPTLRDFETQKYVEQSFKMVEDFVLKSGSEIEIEKSRHFIQYLRSQNIRIALVSAAPRFLIDAALAKMELTRAFYAVFSGYDRLLPKSDPMFYKLILEALHENANNCIVLDDLKEGIVAAKQVGMKAIAFNLGGTAAVETQADFLATSFDEVQTYIDNELRLRVN